MSLHSSVLMSVYHRVKPGELEACLNSLSSQTRQPDEYVIVKDGPLSTELDQRIEEFANRHPSVLVSLPANLGLALALNEGLKACSGTWVFRMDADDIALADRFARQLDFLGNHPEVDVLGSSMLEFAVDPEQPARLKPAPDNHEKIRARLPWRNPMNHPTLCYRRDKVIAAGGYPQLPLLEDYYLWAILMVRGARFHNLTEPCHLYRFDSNTLQRRAGLSNLGNEVWLRWWMARQGLANPVSCLLAALAQVCLRLAPERIRRLLWEKSRNPL